MNAVARRDARDLPLDLVEHERLGPRFRLAGFKPRNGRLRHTHALSHLSLCQAERQPQTSGTRNW